MPRLRFETARDLLDAYPAASDELLIEPVDTPSLRFLAELSGQQPIDKAIVWQQVQGQWVIVQESGR